MSCYQNAVAFVMFDTSCHKTSVFILFVIDIIFDIKKQNSQESSIARMRLDDKLLWW